MNLTSEVSGIFDRIGRLNGITLLRDVPLSQYTRFGIGGPADFYLETADPVSFAKALAMVRASGIESVVIGGGTNLIVADEGLSRRVPEADQRRDFALTDFAWRWSAARHRRQALVDFTVEARGSPGLRDDDGHPEGPWARRSTANAGAYGHI